WYQALHPDDRDKCVLIFKNAFNSRRPFEMEYRLKRLDGHYRNMLDTGEPYISQDDIFSGFIGSSTDVTEQKGSEEQLKHSHKEMELHNSQMRLVNKLNSYLQICRTLEETFPVILYYTRELFPDCSGSVYLLNESRTVVESVVSWGKNSESQIPVITPDDCWSLRQGKPHHVIDTNHGLICMHLKDCPEHGYTCVPIIAQGDMVGMIHIQYPKLNENLTQEEINHNIDAKRRLVNMTADNLALALVSLKLREALKTQSIRDPLTQLFNRRYMEETLEREYSRCKRLNESLGILMLDIDHFKSYNDKYGHNAGDIILTEIAKLLQVKLRKADVACRYGGEEFILIFSGAPLNILEQRAEEIRSDISNYNVNYKGEKFENITVSIGISAFPLHAHSTENLLKTADEALYVAKHTGRDKVVVAKEIIQRKNNAGSENKKNIELRNVNYG
ncbi:MAG: diguanylate cyclase (GGDEF)-like protein, partial [Planctomycetota bacterium]